MKVTSQRHRACGSLALVDCNHAAAILSTPACCSHRIAALAWPFSQRLAHALCSAEPMRKAHFTRRAKKLRSELSYRRESCGDSSRAHTRRAVHARAKRRCRRRTKSRPAGALQLYGEVGVLFTQKGVRRHVLLLVQKGVLQVFSTRFWG